LREVLARLETKQQAIIMGHAVPMPVVIKPRTYDESFYQSVMAQASPIDVQATNNRDTRQSLGNRGKRRL
jgi:DNA helicase HerA-like ATPase